MGLEARGKIENVKASLEKYIYDSLVTASGVSVNMEGLPFEATHRDEWIQENILGVRDWQIHKRDGEGMRGQTTQVILNFNIFVNRKETKKANRHYELRDTIATYFNIGTDVDLYDASNSEWLTSLEKLRLREVITDASIPNDNFYQYNYTVGFEWLAKIS